MNFNQKTILVWFSLFAFGICSQPVLSSNHKQDDHEEGENPKNVGPDKGVISFDEHDGFVLSPQAFKNFKIEYFTLLGGSPWNLPKSALVMTLDELSVFRNREGKLLRVDVKIVSKSQNNALVKSEDLRAGDQIVSQGAGFLRVAELDIMSGESGHHH